MYDDNKFNNKLLLTIPELMEYTGFCEKKVRQLLNNPKSTFTIRNGNKLYAHKELFEEYVKKCAKLGLTL
jgi:hypothetical protein